MLMPLSCRPVAPSPCRTVALSQLPPNRHSIRAGIIAEVIIVDAEEEPAVFIRLACRRAARSDEDQVRISPVAVANLADQRAGSGVAQRIDRCADVRAAVAVGIAAVAVADFNRPFSRNRERHVRLDIDARINPGLIGVYGDGLFAPLPWPRSAASLAASAAINSHVDAEGAARVARLPMIDREI